eukprot:10824733-Alexandrium_andersonii.AAC.1
MDHEPLFSFNSHFAVAPASPRFRFTSFADFVEDGGPCLQQAASRWPQGELHERGRQAFTEGTTCELHSVGGAFIIDFAGTQSDFSGFTTQGQGQGERGLRRGASAEDSTEGFLWRTSAAPEGHALNLEPTATSQSPSIPAPSVPGRVQPETSLSQEEQRGKESFKGDNSNSQSTSGKEFSHHYNSVVPKDFICALGFESFRPGNFKHDPTNVMGDVVCFKYHGAPEYFPIWAEPCMVVEAGGNWFIRPTSDVIKSLQDFVSFWGACIALQQTVVDLCSAEAFVMHTPKGFFQEWQKLRYMRDHTRTCGLQRSAGRSSLTFSGRSSCIFTLSCRWT